MGGGDAPASARPFRDGLVVNLTNPKVILFVLALVPHSSIPARPVLPQFLVLGAARCASGGGLVDATAAGRVLTAGGIGRCAGARPAGGARLLHGP